MSSGKITCIVKEGNSERKKKFKVSSFDELAAQIKHRFELSSTVKIVIFDMNSCEMDTEAFDDYKDENCDTLEVFFKQLTESDKLSIKFILISSVEQSPFYMEITQSSRLSEISDNIITRNGLEKNKHVCFFYSQDGQPLSPSFYTSQFLRAYEVMFEKESIFFIISNNIYESQLIANPKYERNFAISVLNKTMNTIHHLKVNEIYDKEPEIKDLIGLMIGCPSTSIILGKYPESSYEFSLINFKSNLKLSLYNPVLQQSEEGLRLFRNFLHCLPSHIYTEKKNFLACVRYICPLAPFLYSLNLILYENLITESELIALDEGAIILFKKLNAHYQFNFKNEALFEHTLEFFALLLELSSAKSFTKGKDEVFDYKIIANPLKIRMPVIVLLNNNNEEIYDLLQIEDFKRQNKEIPKFKGPIESLVVDKKLEKLIKRTEGVERDELVIIKTVFDDAYDVTQLFRNGPTINSFSDLEKLKLKRSVTQITSYLKFFYPENNRTLTYDSNRKIAINFGIKDCTSDYLIKDIISLNEEIVTIKQIQSLLNQEQSAGQTADLDEEFFSRTPGEAISILIDTSYSMNSFFLETGKNKLEVTKDFFNSFINRSVGYNLPQIFALTTFDTRVTKISNFTKNSFKFSKHLETIQASGDTSIYDAIASAIPDLITIKQTYQNISLRIICFSDGEDNSSDTYESDLFHKIVSNEIILDCVNLGTKCTVLKNLSLCSGGFAFQFNTVEEGFKIFESDAFISLSFRETSEVLQNISFDDLFSPSFKDFTIIPPPYKLPKQINFKAATISSALITMDIAKPKFDSSIGSLRFKRINREMALIYKNPHPDIKIYPCESDIQFWNGIMTGPENTPYEGGNFHFYISFPEEYPHKPPEIRFKTKIYHLNINSSGRICISVLSNDYGPELNIIRLLEYIFGLLMNPEDTGSLDTNIAMMFRNSREQYDEIARKWTQDFASKALSEIFQGISSDELENEIPVKFLCALTKKVMIDPVVCLTSDIIYERKVIEDFINENGYDPITNQKTKVSKLYPDKTLQSEIQIFLSYKIQ